MGKIKVDKDKSALDGTNTDIDEDVSPHDGRVNALAIDERTRYLFSADALGEIFVWRLDAHSKYELLRKFKRDVIAPTAPIMGGNNMLGVSAVTGRTLLVLWGRRVMICYCYKKTVNILSTPYTTLSIPTPPILSTFFSSPPLTPPSPPSSPPLSLPSLHPLSLPSPHPLLPLSPPLSGEYLLRRERGRVWRPGRVRRGCTRWTTTLQFVHAKSVLGMMMMTTVTHHISNQSSLSSPVISPQSWLCQYTYQHTLPTDSLSTHSRSYLTL